LLTNLVAKVDITLILQANRAPFYLYLYLKFPNFLKLIKVYFYKMISVFWTILEYKLDYWINFHKIFCFQYKYFHRIGVFIRFIISITLHLMFYCLFGMQEQLHIQLLFYPYPIIIFLYKFYLLNLLTYSFWHLKAILNQVLT
jgi:hypothetical protein